MSGSSRAQHAALLLEDQAAREAALDTGRSFLLQAPAGSGKTTVLTDRVLALLANAREPEEILAITFTRKAAAEMRARILKALHAPESAVARAALARERAAGWRLLENPERLRVQTIDAFCQALAAQLPVTARLGLQLEVALPATTLYAAAARRVLERALSDQGGDEALPDAVHTLLRRVDNNWSRLEALVQEMLAERAHWLPRVLADEPVDLAARVEHGLRSLIGEQLERLHAALSAAALQQGNELAGHAARTLEASGAVPDAQRSGLGEWCTATAALGATAADLPRWRFWCALALTKAGQWRKKWNKNQGFLPAERRLKEQLVAWVGALDAAGVQELCAEVLALPDERLPARDAAALAALSTLLRQAAAELQLACAARGRVDFTAIAAAARTALTEGGEPTDLALRWGSAIRHVLIDEFQDTSLEQFELLRALSAGWESGDGRTLFAVGDPMQSIYQFREAEVGLFLRARAQGLGAVVLEPLQLRRNFRCGARIVEWVNECGERLFPAEDDLRLAAIRYLTALAAAPGPPGQVCVHPQLSTAPEAEAQQIVDIVRAQRRAKADARIAVLVSARRHAAPIAFALKAAGVSVRGVKLEPLAERPVVRDLCALTRALLHPADRTAWLALLHGPCAGLGLAELLALCEGHADSLWALLNSPEALARLTLAGQRGAARVREALAPALDGAERSLPLWQRVDRAWLRVGGPAAYPEARDLADAQVFVQAISAQPELEQLAGESLEEFAATLYASATAAEQAVEILTLHGAKGLEWDVVIVPGLGRAARGDGESLLHWLEVPARGGARELLLAPIDDASGAAERTLAGYIRRIRRRRRRLEQVRLLYVAATRARESLHWLGAAALGADGQPRPRAGTLLELLWPMLGDAFAGLALPPSMPEGVAAEQSITANLAAVPSYHLAATWTPQGLPAPVNSEGLRLALREAAASPEYSWVGLAARAIGTVVHAELQRLGALSPLPPHLDRPPDDYAAWLAELGVPPEERAQAGTRVLEALERTLADPRGRWLLGEAGRGTDSEAHSEWRITGVHEGRIVNVVIDRFLVDASGECWLVDFKTGSHEGGELEGFLDREVERYRPQLQRYAHLLQDLGHSRLRAALYFPLLGAFREVTLAAGRAR